MPRFVIDEAEVPSIRTERDEFFERKRVELSTHRGRTRSWHLIFIRKNQETLSCRGMHVDMVMHHINSIEDGFNDQTIQRYMMMSAGLRTVIASPEHGERPHRVYLAPRGTCTICDRKGVPYNVCLSCGEESGGLYM